MLAESHLLWRLSCPDFGGFRLDLRLKYSTCGFIFAWAPPLHLHFPLPFYGYLLLDFGAYLDNLGWCQIRIFNLIISPGFLYPNKIAVTDSGGHIFLAINHQTHDNTKYWWLFSCSHKQKSHLLLVERDVDHCKHWNTHCDLLISGSECELRIVDLRKFDNHSHRRWISLHNREGKM